MNRPISISFSPNFEADDIRLAWKLLGNMLAGTQHNDKREAFRQDLGKTLQSPYVFLFSSARAGLYMALRSLNFRNDDEVILQAFTCVAVPAAIKWANLRPVFADANKGTYNLDVDDVKRKITSRTRAIIVQHTFGIPGPLKELRELASKHDIVLVEDCAHVMGSSVGNKQLGSFGDVSVFSFGRDKALSSVFGGAVTTSRNNIANNLKKLEEQLEDAPVSFAAQQLFYVILYSIALPLYRLQVGKLMLWLSARLGFLSRAVYPSEYGGKKPHFINYSFHPSLCVLAHQQFKKLERYNEHRKEIAKIYISALSLDLNPDATYLRVPLQVKQKQSFLAYAKKRGVHLGNWYRSPIDPPQANPSIFNYEDCPTARELSQHTVNLPTHINISPDDAQKIIELCKPQL